VLTLEQGVLTAPHRKLIERGIVDLLDPVAVNA
jgi:hypothetical protein